MHDCFVNGRVERVARFAECGQPELAQHGLELVGYRLERAGQVAVGPSPVDVVEHRQQPDQRVTYRSLG